MFWLLIVFIGCVFYVYLNQGRKKFTELAKTLPGELTCLPIIGHAYVLAGSDEANMKVFQKVGMIAVKRGGLASYWMANHLYVAFCTSLYTSGLWVSYSQKQYNALRVQYNNAFRVLMGLPRFCSASGMFAEERVDCFYATMRKRCTSLARRVRSSTNGILRAFSERFDLVADPADGEILLKTCLEKDEAMDMLKFLFGNGSIYAPVSIWRPRRKLLAPTFSIKTLNRFVDVFAKQSLIMADRLTPLVGNGTFPLWKYLTTYTFYSVCETTLGVRINAQDNPNNTFLEAFEEAAELMTKRMLQPWLHPEWIYQLLPEYRRADKCRRTIHELIDKIIKQKRQEMEEKQREENYAIKSGFQSLLEMLLETSLKVKGFTDLELREETLVMTAAGTDTSAVGASFALVMLSRYPEVQERVLEELNEVLDCPDKAVAAEDLHMLKYLEAVIKETLRLYPPVPVIVRKVTSDTELQSGVTIPAGTGILMHIWATHRNPRYWGPDADLFRPERFLEPLTHPAQFVPFSYGVRGCIGYQYAMMSMKTVLATVLRKYRVLPPAGADVDSLKEPIRVKYDIMMKAVDMFQIQLESRTPIISREIG